MILMDKKNLHQVVFEEVKNFANSYSFFPNVFQYSSVGTMEDTIKRSTIDKLRKIKFSIDRSFVAR